VPGSGRQGDGPPHQVEAFQARESVDPVVDRVRHHLALDLDLASDANLVEAAVKQA